MYPMSTAKAIIPVRNTMRKASNTSVAPRRLCDDKRRDGVWGLEPVGREVGDRYMVFLRLPRVAGARPRRRAELNCEET